MTAEAAGAGTRPLRIDVHVHLGGLGACHSGITVSPRFRRGFVFRSLIRSLGVRAHEMADADRLYVDRLADLVRASTAIDRAVVLALDGRWTGGVLDVARSALVVPNDWARDAARSHPDAFLYGASVSPLRADALDELARVADEGAVLVKWLPNIMGIDPADVRHVPFYRKLVDLGLPLLTHGGHEFTLPGGEGRLGDPLRLNRALDEGVTVLAAHCGTLCRVRWEDGAMISGVEAVARMTVRWPRLYAELSALTTILRGWALGRILDDPRLRERLVDASDFPVPCAPWTQLGRVPLGEILAARRLINPFDRDRALKVAAGMPEDATFRAASILRLPGGGQALEWTGARSR